MNIAYIFSIINSIPLTNESSVIITNRTAKMQFLYTMVQCPFIICKFTKIFIKCMSKLYE